MYSEEIVLNFLPFDLCERNYNFTFLFVKFIAVAFKLSQE